MTAPQKADAAFGGARMRRLGALIALVGVSHAAAPPSAAAGIDGAWSYFGNPRAVHTGGATFFGFVNSRGDIGVGRYSHRTRSTRMKIIAPRFDKDDHNNPSLYVRPDGRIVAFWSPHSGHHLPRNGPSRLYLRTSCRPRSIDCFGPTRTIAGNTGANRLGYTYPSPVYVQDSRTLWLFWRGGHWQPSYARSRDHGRTWTRPRTLLSGGRKVYAVYAAADDGFHVALTPDNPAVGADSLYYLRYRRGKWLRADGTVVGRLSARTSLRRGDRIDPRAGERAAGAWVMDIAEDHRGRPVVLFRAGGPRRGYWRALWTGERWRHDQIVQSDHLRSGASIGGASLDHEDPRIVYLSRIRAGRTQILLGAEHADDSRWAFTAVTRPSRVANLRPTSPLGLTTSTTVLWMRGYYKGFRRFRTSILIKTLPALTGPETPTSDDMRKVEADARSDLARRLAASRSNAEGTQ